MLELHQKLVAAEAHDRTLVQRQIAATDRQIDQLVYQLYDLTWFIHKYLVTGRISIRRTS
jgi:hypothetical protein